MSVIRIYKSGKFYLVRTNIKTVADEPAIKIYNENKFTMQIQDVTSDSNVVTLLEIQGIKFTTRSFQIEIEMKQMMVLNDDEMFDNCLIKTQPIKKKVSKSVAINPKNNIIPPSNLSNTSSNIKSNNVLTENTNVEIEKMETETETEKIEKNPLDLEIEDLDMGEIKDEVKDELKEVNDLIIDNLETVSLKKPNQVYFELYKKAREKAKAAKKDAILSFLEAKHIKETYMIDLFNDNESDIDAEIDAVSEKELDNL